ncbi:metal-dependent transcriptional regulator [Glycomyces buryatensis]|uniref:Metal-dependent transcriptional regulator n=1 Tax=Glycomyces buryatensis TaxID=2570927 RepID=A0A4S8QE31_9ACTN|nr:metal-dependent transcriptional regulator [Glycomyces buryatensis]THV42658.1 metal-dependent transcriptional regulator [Glycomyces buryatensis]
MTTDLVDTTEMYLRTILELEEEGVPALRARIAERLDQSGPTVSQTVGRMQRHGLLNVKSDRHLELTEEGRRQAVAVMRKHRLAERLLVDVIGMSYIEAHDEACKWEHVMSDAVEKRVYELLKHPTRSPYGNSIPGLQALDSAAVVALGVTDERPMSVVAPGSKVRVTRLCESVQTHPDLLSSLHRAGIDPEAEVLVDRADGDVVITADSDTIRLSVDDAAKVFAAPVE